MKFRNKVKHLYKKQFQDRFDILQRNIFLLERENKELLKLRLAEKEEYKQHSNIESWKESLYNQQYKYISDLKMSHALERDMLLERIKQLEANNAKPTTS